MWTSLRNDWLCGVLAGAALFCCTGADAATVVLGTAVDGATDAALAGAEIVLTSDAEVRARALSDENGKFQLQFDASAAAGVKSFELSASLSKYRALSRTIEIDRGRPTENRYLLRLLPEAVASCIQKTRPAVVVGYFRAAPGRPDPELSERVADALRYDLLTQIQKARFTSAAQPGIFPCRGAAPVVQEQYGGFARLLHADAFVAGYVTSPNPVKVKVQMTIADGYGALAAPLNATSNDVDLDDPQLARLDPKAHEAVLTALAIGYKLTKKPQECVDLIAAAERMLQTLPEVLRDLRKECQGALPNRGLL